MAGVVGAFLRSPEMQGPILQPDKPWEGGCAMPFSGGLWKTAHGYRLYYLANFNRVCLAVSDDGLRWDKPDWGVIPGTNVLLEIAGMDSFSVVPHDHQWHMIASTQGGGKLRLLTSRHGLWWQQAGEMPWAGDRTTLWWNPAKERWTFNVRQGQGIGGDPRRIDRVESETFIPRTWEPREWLRADFGDGDIFSGAAQLYAVDVVPDRDRLCGLFTIWKGLEANRPKLNDVYLGFSKDGDVFEREYTPVLTMGSKGSWNYGNVQSVTGGLIRIGERVRLYASGRDGIDGGNGKCSMGYREFPLGFGGLHGL